MLLGLRSCGGDEKEAAGVLRLVDTTRFLSPMPHLLLVDDDDLFRESLGLNLIDEGYEVTSLGNGRDALAYLEGGGAADVVLLDWRMPNLTGLDVLRRLRRAGITIPVIFLTVLSDEARKLSEAAALIHHHVTPDGGDADMPTTILVDRRGTVRWIYRSPSVIARLSPDEVLRAIDQHIP